MNDNATPLESLFQKAEDYSKTTVELLKLTAVDKTADITSSLISRLVVLMAFALCILIVSVGIALWIGNVLDKTYYGFFIVGAFYAVIALILYGLRNKWIKEVVSNSIIAQLLKQGTA